METWPEDVPYSPRANSLKGTPFVAPLATDMEDGAQRTRRASTLNLATLSFVIKMENPEFEAFKVWVRDVLVDGTLRFNMPIWTGSDYEVRVCKFQGGAPYSDDPGRGMRHLVSVALNVENY